VWGGEKLVNKRGTIRETPGDFERMKKAGKGTDRNKTRGSSPRRHMMKGKKETSGKKRRRGSGTHAYGRIRRQKEKTLRKESVMPGRDVDLQ